MRRVICWSPMVLVLLPFAPTGQAENPPPKTGLAKKNHAESPWHQFLEKHCVDCHSGVGSKGGFDLETLKEDFTQPKERDRWVRVWDRIRTGDMPPRNKPRPEAKEKDAALAWLAGQTRESMRFSGLRRMNRIEFENTLRDLLDLPQLDIRELLPEDGEVQGFDKVGGALGISHVQMAGYLSAVDDALDQATEAAMRESQPPHEKRKLYPQDEPTWQNRLGGGQCVPLAENEPDPIYNRVTGRLNVKKDEEYVKGPRIKACGTLFHYDAAGRLMFNERQNNMAPGNYRVTVSSYAFMWDKGKVLPIKEGKPFRLSTWKRLLGYFDAPPDKPVQSTFTTWLEPNDQIHFNPVTLHHGIGLDKEGAKGYAGPGVAIEWIELDGPINPVWPPRVRTLLYGDLSIKEWKHESKTTQPSRQHQRLTARGPTPKLMTVESTKPLADAETLIHAFMEKACRRRVTREETVPYLKLVAGKLEQKATLEEGLRTAYKSILCSPSFLFLPDDNGQKDDTVLASRLSYFLWSSMPDDELMKLGLAGTLHQPETLRSQTERLLQSPKSRRFVEDFTGQWLRLRKINATSPDKELYPDGDLESDVAPYLWESMVEESRAFFTAMLRDDLSVSHIIDSDFVMVNEIMARRYGIPGVQGAAMRPVKVSPERHRGGLLTQASILKVTANGTTTSPVARGAWVMTNLMGRQPPPPPPNVPAIDPDVSGATGIRDRLAKHRGHVACAGCHAQFDPAGFALESYDVLGNYRDRYRIILNKRLSMEGPRVECEYELADGRKFRNIEEFRVLMLADKDQLARNIAEKLLLYGRGRLPSLDDRLEIDGIVTKVREKGSGLRSILHEVTQSRAWRE